MPRQAREMGENGYYHLVIRVISRRVLIKDRESISLYLNNRRLDKGNPAGMPGRAERNGAANP